MGTLSRLGSTDLAHLVAMPFVPSSFLLLVVKCQELLVASLLLCKNIGLQCDGKKGLRNKLCWQRERAISHWSAWPCCICPKGRYMPLISINAYTLCICRDEGTKNWEKFPAAIEHAPGKHQEKVSWAVCRKRSLSQYVYIICSKVAQNLSRGPSGGEPL